MSRVLGLYGVLVAMTVAPGCAQESADATALFPVVEQTVWSELLQEDRTIRVVLPRTYDGGATSYPVVYVLDGEANLEATVGAVDHLSRNLQMPESIVVAVHNTAREADLTPEGLERDLPDGTEPRGDRFLEFLENELVPFVEQGHRTSTLRILVGHSQGGLFGVYALSVRPELFPWIIALDAPMNVPAFHPVVRSFEQRLHSAAHLKGRLFNGTAIYGWSDEDWDSITDVDRADFRTYYRRFDDETHQSVVLPGVHAGLRALFADLPQPMAYPQTLAEIDSVFGETAAEYGHEVVPGLPYLTRMAADLLLLRQGSDALAVLARINTLYGPSSRQQELEEAAAEVVSEGEMNREGQLSLRELLARPRPSAEEANVYLGEWSGTSFHEGGVPVELHVTFIRSGVEVTGTMHQRIGRLESREELRYIHITADGALEFGHLNRRRPGGLIVSVVRPDEEGVLRGVQDIRGIDLERMFPGRSFPANHVTLHKVASR